MKKKILITGGAGFIGSHVACELCRAGYCVRALDTVAAPQHLPDEVQRVPGDVRDLAVLGSALEDIDAVFHFATSDASGPFPAVNDLGTSCLLEAIVENRIEKLIVASSMTVYGEGLYVDASGRSHEHTRRHPDALAHAEWEPRDDDGLPLQPLPTPESKPAALESSHALGNHAREQAVLIIGRAYDIPIVALRFFNVYGPPQPLALPHPGAIALFVARCLKNQPPLIFEDGGQRRDFVHVDDVARACRLALESERANGQILNIGSGRSHSVREVARSVARVLRRPRLQPECTGEYRTGDIRHCFADISRAKALLGYAPSVELEEGLQGMADQLLAARRSTKHLTPGLR